MGNVIGDLYSEISAINTLEAYKTRIPEIIKKLNDCGLADIAEELRQISGFNENKFSSVSTLENMKQSQARVLSYIEAYISLNNSEVENPALEIVKRVIKNFHLFCKSLYKEPIHGKCSDAFKNNLPRLEIGNEYDVQQLMYPIIRSLFPDARLEKSEDSGHHTIRKDIIIDSQDIVIELKCSRKSMTERSLGDEVAADMVHYTDKYLFFYIYDKENAIKNPITFKDTYENKIIDSKKVFVEIFQPIEL